MRSICHHFIILAVLCFISGILVGCITDDHDENKGVKVGEYLPEFAVYVHADDSLDWRFTGMDFLLSADSFKDKVGILVFFNTDCEDCQKELPEIQKLYDSIKDSSSYQLVCIAREETESDIRKYWKENNLTLPYSALSDRSVYELFAETIIPRIYIVKQGIVTHIHTDSSIVGSSQLINEIK